VAKYTIKKLDENDWRIFKQIRLRALASDPHVFGSTFERESKNSKAEWCQPLSDADGAIFILFSDSEPIGMTGIAIYGVDTTGRTAILWGSWLEPEFRGKGLSRYFYKARLDWAIIHPRVERVIVTHRASNRASKSANQKFGFVKTHVTEKVWNDGITEKEFHYELKL